MTTEIQNILQKQQNYTVNYYDHMLKNKKSMKDFLFFEELKTLSDLSFKYYKVPEPLANVIALADEMVYQGDRQADYKYLLKDTYHEYVIID